MIKNFVSKYGDRLENKTEWGLEWAHDFGKYKIACKNLNIDIQENAQELFQYAISNFFGQGESKYKKIALRVLEECDVTVDDPYDLKDAIQKDEVALAVSMIKYGGARLRDVDNWRKIASQRMIRELSVYY